MEVQEKDQSFNKNKFKLDTSVRYPLPVKWDKKVNVDDLTSLRIYINEQDSFVAKNLNVFTNYVQTFYINPLEAIMTEHNRCNIAYYQNQINFAVWCASAGCGVSVEHINTDYNLLSSVFKFHIYYQVRKILQEMSCPIPGESLFNPSDNHINMVAYKKICNQFNVDVNSDFRFMNGRTGYHTTTRINGHQTWIQDGAVEGWKQFILEKSKGFTRAGAVRIDDSIRTYVYCVLGSQAQTRSNIMKSFECQQNFVNLLESSVKSLFSIPESIQKYQDAISRTGVRINYAIGIGLYMISSDLNLQVGIIQKYNNNLVIANDSTKIGENEDINLPKPTPNHTPVIKLDDTTITEVTPIPEQSNYTPEIGAGVSILVFSLFLLFSSR